MAKGFHLHIRGRRFIGEHGVEPMGGELAEQVFKFSFAASHTHRRMVREDWAKNVEAEEFWK